MAYVYAIPVFELPASPTLFLFNFDASFLFQPQFDEEFLKPVSRGLSPEEMKRLPLVAQNTADATTVCTICQEKLFTAKDEQEQVMRVREMTGCKHHYHEDCIFEWLKEAKTCPVCRSEHVIVKKEDIPPKQVDTCPSIKVEVVPTDIAKPPADQINLESSELECALNSLNCCWQSTEQSGISSSFVRMNSCGHIYHSNCIESTSRIQHGSHTHHQTDRCPVCRKDGHYDMI